MNNLFNYIQRFNPAVFFISFASIFGLIFLFITPPFQIPDEINHFYRAYQISEGHLIVEQQNKRIGGYLPKSLVQITEPFLGLRGNKQVKTNYKTIIEQFKTPLIAEDTVFVDFPNTGMYSPISYFPQAVSIIVLRKLNAPPLYIFYGARIFSLFFWILSIFCAIKIIPFYKWVFALIALLPMSLFINMSLSADVVTNLLSFLLIAYILNLAYSKENISLQNITFTIILALFLALAKLVYVPILLLILLIPKEKFHSKRIYIINLIVLFVVSLGPVLIWSKILNGLYLPYSLYNPQYRDSATLSGCADMQTQMLFVLENGKYVCAVFINSMINTFDMYFQGYIGTFGWLDTKLPIWLVYLAYGIIFIVASIDGRKVHRITLYHKILIFISLLLVTSLILISQYLTWDCIGDAIIITIQGKYFIPSFPLLFLLLYNSRLNYSKIAAPLVIIFSIISLIFSTNTLYERYYKVPYLKSLTITCDAETVTNDNLFQTNISSVLLENGNTRSDEKSKSGRYSARLTPDRQFGFTYRLYNCKKGDSLKIETWRLGTTGGIIIQGGKDDFYLGQASPFEKDSMGWEHIKLYFQVPKDMNSREIGICIYNEGNTISYFDDLVITLKKIQND